MIRWSSITIPNNGLNHKFASFLRFQEAFFSRTPRFKRETKSIMAKHDNRFAAVTRVCVLKREWINKHGYGWHLSQRQNKLPLQALRDLCIGSGVICPPPPHLAIIFPPRSATGTSCTTVFYPTKWPKWKSWWPALQRSQNRSKTRKSKLSKQEKTKQKIRGLTKQSSIMWDAARLSRTNSIYHRSY